MGIKVKIDVEGVRAMHDAVGSIMNHERAVRMNREIGFALKEATADHLARASVSRHTVANRLGAQYTRFLEFAPGRVANPPPGRVVGKYTGEPKPYIDTEPPTADLASVVVCNTPGMARAFGPLTIVPRMRKMLTIPIDKEAYGRSVKDFRQLGKILFRPHGTKILAISEWRGRKRRGSADAEDRTWTAKVRPMYALVRRVRLPQDRGLLPSKQDVQDVAADTAEAFLAMEADGLT